MIRFFQLLWPSDGYWFKFGLQMTLSWRALGFTLGFLPREWRIDKRKHSYDDGEVLAVDFGPICFTVSWMPDHYLIEYLDLKRKLDDLDEERAEVVERIVVVKTKMRPESVRWIGSSY